MELPSGAVSLAIPTSILNKAMELLGRTSHTSHAYYYMVVGRGALPARYRAVGPAILVRRLRACLAPLELQLRLDDHRCVSELVERRLRARRRKQVLCGRVDLQGGREALESMRAVRDSDGQR